MKPMDIIFIGAVLVIIGGIIGAVGTRMQNKASSLKSDKQLDKIQELNDQNAKLSNSITHLSSQNSSLSNEIGDLSGQNGKLMSELLSAREDLDKVRLEAFNNTFGSKGGIILQGNSCLKIYNESKLPMYDVKIFITNYDALLTCNKMVNNQGEIMINESCYKKMTKQYTVGIIYGETVFDFEDYVIVPNTSYRVMVKIITKKGTYYQQLTQSKELGTAFRILEQEEVGKYWNQYLDKDPDKPFTAKDEAFQVVKEKSLRKEPVNWNKEFPLPVSFKLF